MRFYVRVFLTLVLIITATARVPILVVIVIVVVVVVITAAAAHFLFTRMLLLLLLKLFLPQPANLPSEKRLLLFGAHSLELFVALPHVLALTQFARIEKRQQRKRFGHQSAVATARDRAGVA